MTIKQALIWAIKQLKTSNSPALDAEALLSFVLKKDKTFLFAHSEKKLTSNQLEKFKKLIVRRAKHEPVAYITNNKEFYGLNFYVDENVLIPRPATESMVEKALKIISNSKRPITLIDVGTGSGCIMISILKWIPASAGMTRGGAGMTVVAIDSSKEALKIAQKNAKKHDVANRVKFVYSNLLEKIKTNDNILITANLPYLTTEQYKNLPPEIKKYEPKSALVAGKDGMRYYKKLFKQIKTLNLKSQLLYECQSGRLQSKSFLN
ncbi:MAG: peptide chain release factor N(5)-glutamine methyltransferase [Patescibacteria group bacterium]|nr:peptide chain release factor N(5)-glutamine methyltransferase [Patescibacteria group bacterium]